MSLIRRLVSEPLTQFLLIGCLVYGGYLYLARDVAAPEGGKIVVSEGRIAQLRAFFAKTWQRPPTEDELEGLIEGYIKEEIFYREAVRLGFDKDDTIVRRRMQQKMGFAMEPSESALTPKPGELEAFFKETADQFRVPARLSFEQIFYDPAGVPQADLEDRIRSDLERLRSGQAEDPVELGDRSLLPLAIDEVYLPQVAGSFGEDFARTLEKTAAGAWTGPLRSAYGLHLVRISRFEPAHLPAFDDVSGDVRFEWESLRRAEIAEENYQKLRSSYDIEIKPVPEDGPSGGDGSPAAGRPGAGPS